MFSDFMKEPSECDKFCDKLLLLENDELTLHPIQLLHIDLECIGPEKSRTLTISKTGIYEYYAAIKTVVAPYVYNTLVLYHGASPSEMYQAIISELGSFPPNNY